MAAAFYRTRAHLALIVANLIYGLNFSIAKSVMPDFIKPLALLSIRSVITASLFWGTSFFLPKEKVEKRDLLYLFGCSFLGVVITQALFLKGLDMTTPINSCSSICFRCNHPERKYIISQGRGAGSRPYRDNAADIAGR
jgi:drug/metabolite transporter (DMT)-like permease